MIVSTENATPLKSTKSRKSNSAVQIQTKSRTADTKNSEFLDLVDFAILRVYQFQWKLTYNHGRNV